MEQPENTRPQPMPSHWVFNELLTAKGKFAVVEIHDAAGVAVKFLSPDQLVQIGQVMVRLGHEMRTGLVIPENGLD